jgi:hypothetical protein
MKIMKTVLLTALVAGLAAGVSLAGKGDTFQDWADPEKAYKKVWLAPGPSQLKKMTPEDFPKRVGLISFYLFDTGVHEFNAMAATYGGSYSKQFGLNEAGANLFATEFASRGVPVLKKRFAEHGMELLTPVEFLKTQAQIDAYLALELPKSGWQKFAKAVRGWLDKNPNATGAADGYSMTPTHLWLDAGVLGALEELRVALGLDALAAVSNLSGSNPKTVGFAGASLAIFGPNPEPKPEKFAKYWFPGLAYAQGNFGKGFKGLTFAYWSKGKSGKSTSVTNPVSGNRTTYSGKSIERAEYDGYEGIIDGLARKTLEELDKRLGRGK